MPTIIMARSPAMDKRGGVGEVERTMEELRFLQIEPTTRCNFTCGFCAGRAMPQEDIGYEAFERTLASFPGVAHLELQGEGESLMHPRFFDMILLARKRGARVSFISNGSYFSPEVIEKI